MAEITTVKVTKRTRERLAELGKKNETYEEIIQRLIVQTDHMLSATI